MKEINPNHPVTKILHDNWHKIAAMLLFKQGVGTVVEITLEDIVRLDKMNLCIVVKDKDNKLTVFLVDSEEGNRLAREEGGLPA